MKKALSLLLSIIMIVTSIAFPLSAVAATSSLTVDLSKTYQTMNGFGASGCWWAKEVGGWENLNDVMTLLYDKEKGIGLNIYRYNLGSDSINDELHYRGDRHTESFLNADGTYDFSKDMNAQLTLAAARRLAGDNLRVTLFCNSAPIYMTKNGCGIANDYWWDQNLEKDKYDAFADYGYECVNFFQNQGYRITDISPINEPFGHWCRDNEWVPDLDENGNKIFDSNGNETGHYIYYDWAGQEGSFYTMEGVRDVTTAFIKKLKSTDAFSKGCKVSTLEANDMANNDNSIANYLECLFSESYPQAQKNSFIRNNINTITMHSYFSTLEGKKATAQLLKDTYKGKYNVAQTEYCQMDIDPCNGLAELYAKEGMTSGLGIDYGLALAKVMYDDLTVFDAVEWDWWTAVAFGGYTDGLVYVNQDTHQIETSKRLYTMGNFSKFTDEGSVRVDASTNSSALKSIAFSNPDGTISIVLINASSAAQQTQLNLKGFGSSCYSYTSYVTDETRDLAKYQSSNGSNTVTAPAKSITTVVVKPCSSHSVVKTVTPATLSKNGSVVSKCKSCGKTISTTAISMPKTITLSASSYVYDGKVKAPKVTVKDSKGKAIAASNYTVSYASGRKNVGKYAVKITFKGNYSGTKTLYFTIVPKGTTIASLTAGSKAMTVKWKKQATQTTGYQIQYSTDANFKKGNKTVNIGSSKTVSKKITKLTGKKKYYVRVRTYKKVGSTTYYSAWSAKKNIVTKK